MSKKKSAPKHGVDKNGYPTVKKLVPKVLPPPPPDPAKLVARRMIEVTLECRPDAAIAASARGSVVVLITPAEGWCAVISEEWRKMLHNDVRSESDQLVDAFDGDVGPQPVLLMRTAATDKVRHDDRDRGDESNAVFALREGKPVVLAAPDISYLPQDLVRVADAVFHFGPPERAEAAEASALCLGGKARWDAGELLSMPTPRMLRICYRPGRTASQCHARLAAEARMAAPAGTKTVAAAQTLWTLDNLSGMPSVVAWGRALAADISAYKEGKISWEAVDKGCMMVGPPGCGKTTAAAAIAATCGVPFLPSSFSAWSSGKGGGHLSDIQREMRKVFDEAKKLDEPCILFIDELDSMQARNPNNHWDEWWRTLVNCLLMCISGAEERGKVVVVGAANSIEGIDPALLRAGRLDQVIRIPLPDTVGLLGILRAHLGSDLDGVDIQHVARMLLGRSGADCEKAVRMARRAARAAGRAMLPEDLLAAVSDGRRTREPAFRRRLAYHEAGHAVVGHIRKPGSVRMATVGEVAGFLAGVIGEVDLGEQRVADVVDYASMLLAGRAAEEVFLGDVSAACGGGEDGDLGYATCLVARVELGGAGEGLLWHGELTARRVADLLSMRKDLSERVEAHMETAYSRAVKVLEANRDAVERVAVALLEQEVLDADDVAALVEGVR